MEQLSELRRTKLEMKLSKDDERTEMIRRERENLAKQAE